MQDKRAILGSSDTDKHTFVASAFNGGMIRIIDPSKLGEDQYSLLVNGRPRYASIKSIRAPHNLTANLEVAQGNYQGVYGVDSLLAVFVNGNIFLKDFSLEASTFNTISTFNALSSSVDYIYAQLVPASFQDLKRVLRSAGDERDIKFDTLTGGSPACLVCQDGINQPRLLFNNGLARNAAGINDWSRNDDPAIDNREYVPVGKQMMYHPDGKLYIISPDGREIYHSVTGRPLDFVIAVDTNGNKLSIDPAEEEASRLSYSLSYQPLTCMTLLNTQLVSDDLSSGFYVSSAKDSWLIVPNYVNLIYGEPKFRNIHLFPTGALNQFSVTSLLGDTVLTDFAGLKSFNAISQFSSNGENSPFSANIHDLFEDVNQEITASFYFSNYGFFGVNTKFGPGVLVFDELLDRFVSLDIFDDVTGSIKMFASIVTQGVRKLFFITESGLYEYFGGTAVLTTSLYTKEWFLGRALAEQKPISANLVFRKVKTSGTVTLKTYIDRKLNSTKTRNVTATSLNQDNIPVTLPFNSEDEEATEVVTFKLNLESSRGTFVGFFIQFDFDAELFQVELVTEPVLVNSSNRQSSSVYSA